MKHEYDPGYVRRPFRRLCEEYPDESVYPQADFRTEWGPIFHRGRLNGAARVLGIGQDPAASEAIARRILVGAAGQRVQGFLGKLGIIRRYVLVNVFIYSIYSQAGGERHRRDPAIIAYRNRWLDALLAPGKIQAVVAFGGLADDAWQAWRATPAGAASSIAYRHVKHPTWPESSSNGDADRLAQATRTLLLEWNAAIEALRPAITRKELKTPFVPYGDTWTDGDTPPIPEFDLPAGLPAWMRGGEPWAARVGDTAAVKRATVVVTVPPESLPPRRST